MKIKFESAFVYFFNDDKDWPQDNGKSIKRRVKRIPKVLAAYDRLLPHKVISIKRHSGAWYRQKVILKRHMEWIKEYLYPNLRGRRIRFGFDRNNWIWYFESSKDAILFKLQMEI